MTASAILDIIAPQFKDDTDKASFISLARGQTSSCFYGTKTEQAVALRTAHMMALRDIAEAQASLGGAGEIASKREGDLAISFHKSSANGESKDADLNLTSYGKQLIGLRAGSGPFMGVLSEECDNGCGS